MAVLLAQHRANGSAAVLSDCNSPLLPPIPEHTLLSDILYIFQGIDGQFIRFRSPPPPPQGPRRTYLRGEIVTDGPGVADEPPEGGWGEGGAEQTYEEGIEFVLAASGYSLPAPTRALLHQLSELGWLYRKIEGALKGGAEAGLLAEKAARKGKGNGKGKGGEKQVGMVEQSLHAELKKEMTEYFRLVTVLEAKLEEVDNEDDAPAVLEGVAAVESLTGGLTLRKLDVWTQDVRLRMRMMGTLIAEVGGAFRSLPSVESRSFPFDVCRSQHRWSIPLDPPCLHLQRRPFHLVLLLPPPPNPLRPLLLHPFLLDLRRRAPRPLRRVFRCVEPGAGRRHEGGEVGEPAKDGGSAVRRAEGGRRSRGA